MTTTVTETALDVSPIIGKMISYVDNSTVYAINGVRVQSNGRGYRLDATDGKRLATFRDANGDTAELDVIVPRDAIKSAKIGVRTDSVRIECRDGDWSIVNGQLRVQFVPLDGTFPPVDDVIPEQDREADSAIGLNCEYLADAATLCREFNRRHCDVPGLKFQLGRANRAVRFDVGDGDGRSLVVVVMPLHLG